MNNYKYKFDTTVFDEKLNSVVAKVKYDYANNKLTTQTDFMYALKEALIDFYSKLGEPTFEFKGLGTVPSIEDYKRMIDDILIDLSSHIKGCSEMSYKLFNSQKYLKESVSVLHSRAGGMIKKVNELEKKIELLRSASSTVYIDTFNEKSNFYLNSNEEDVDKYKEAFADISNGVLVLPVTNNLSLMSGAEIEILNSSNGFPGNTHEVYPSSSAINDFKYIGETNTHTSLANIHPSASNYEDWFEFEMYNLSSLVESLTSKIGFKYKEGVSWVVEDETLKLDLKIKLTSPTELNHVIIKAKAKGNTSVSNPFITEVFIFDEIAGSQLISVNKELEDKNIFNFASQVVSEITLRFTQQDAYETNACRQFALNIDSMIIPKFLDKKNENYIKYEFPTTSIEMLNLKFDKKNKSIIYPSTVDRKNFVDQEYAKSQLFYMNDVNTTSSLQYESVKALRYCIALEQIDIRYREFKHQGIYVSKLFETDEPIRTLTLNAEDFIPESFRVLVKAGSEAELETLFYSFIKYFISFDDGGEWIAIMPRHKSHIKPCCITVNSNVAIVNRNENITYYDSLLTPTSFKVRIELSGPDYKENETPIVSMYSVEISQEEVL